MIVEAGRGVHKSRITIAAVAVWRKGDTLRTLRTWRLRRGFLCV